LHAACLNPLYAALSSSIRRPSTWRVAGYSRAPRPAPTIPRPWPFGKGRRQPARPVSRRARLQFRHAARNFPVARRKRRPARCVLRQARIRLAACCVPVARRGHQSAREGLVFETPRPDVRFLLVDRSSRSPSWDALHCTARRHRGLPCSCCEVWGAFPQKRPRRCMNNARAAAAPISR
jgi:hypothetical protein